MPALPEIGDILSKLQHEYGPKDSRRLVSRSTLTPTMAGFHPSICDRFPVGSRHARVGVFVSSAIDHVAEFLRSADGLYR